MSKQEEIHSLIYEAQQIKRLRYKAPLPKKKQRILSVCQENGPVRIFSEEEIFLYKLKKIGQEVFFGGN